jgi:hypothetical protein
MIPKEFESVTKDDIDSLVANLTPEGRDLEYKELLPGKSSKDVHEFLADVSSFANASGGDLLYGIREKRDSAGQPTGMPETAQGLPGINADAEKLRLEQMLLSGIDPRIPGIRLKHLEGFPARSIVIVIRVPKSWAAPHMVKLDYSSRFFSRTSAGKYQLDVREIRAQFLLSESLGDRIGSFRSDRLGKIMANETPVPLEPGPRLVLHLLPVASFAEQPALDLRSAQQHGSKLVPMGRPQTYGPLSFNFNGLFSSGGNESQKPFSYLQLFRNGAFEAVYARTAMNRLIYGIDWEQQVIRMGPSYMQFQKQIGLRPPLFIAISILSARSFIVVPSEPNGPHGLMNLRPIEEDALLAPEVLLEDQEADVQRLLRPAFDTFWQASGWPGSPGYDANGSWVGHKSLLQS